MDFKLGKKEEALRAEIRKFAKEELPAGWVGPSLVDGGECRDWEFAMSIAKKLAQKGWLVMSWPKEYGGQGASLWEQTIYEIE